MDLDNGWRIVCGVMALVLLINIGLIYTVWRRRGKMFGPMHGIRSPWDEEEEAVSELHRRVHDLRNMLDTEEPTPDD